MLLKMTLTISISVTTYDIYMLILKAFGTKFKYIFNSNISEKFLKCCICSIFNYLWVDMICRSLHSVLHSTQTFFGNRVV